jgi:hypothetical protein
MTVATLRVSIAEASLKLGSGAAVCLADLACTLPSRHDGAEENSQAAFLQKE